LLKNYILIFGDWGLGIGDLGFGGLGQSPNPQTQTPKTQNTGKKKKKIINFKILIINKKFFKF